MKAIKFFLLSIAFVTVIIFGIFFVFTLWNNITYQSYSESTIGINSFHSKQSTQNKVKVMTYNIHYGSGLSNTQKRIDEKGIKRKLDDLVRVLKEADADIVFMQEVDFHSSRSHKINQAKYLSEKAGYAFYAIAPHWIQRWFPDLYGRHGQLNHGLCVLSKFPLKNNQSKAFPLLKDAPFFIRWLYNPHGVQKVEVMINSKTITLINVHLDPWSIRERQEQIQRVLHWTQSMTGPMIIGGDFNVEPPETEIKSMYHLKDIPWFISCDQKDLQREQTIQMIKQKDFSTLLPIEHYLSNPSSYHTFPSNNPKVKLDYIFVSKDVKITKGRVLSEAKNASDHLPVILEVNY